MKVPEDVAERGHLDLAIGLNEGTLGRGLEMEDRPVASAFFFFKTTEASNLSRGTLGDFCQK